MTSKLSVPEIISRVLERRPNATIERAYGGTKDTCIGFTVRDGNEVLASCSESVRAAWENAAFTLQVNLNPK